MGLARDFFFRFGPAGIGASVAVNSAETIHYLTLYKVTGGDPRNRPFILAEFEKREIEKFRALTGAGTATGDNALVMFDKLRDGSEDSQLGVQRFIGGSDKLVLDMPDVQHMDDPPSR